MREFVKGCTREIAKGRKRERKGSRMDGMVPFGLMALAVFWAAALAAWLVAGWFAVRKWGRPARIARNLGIAAWLALALFLGLATGKELFLDKPLARAASHGDVSEVRSLLARGASPNATVDAYPAIVLAASAGRTEIVQVLIEHGADVNAEADDGLTALAAAKADDQREVVRLLKKAGAKR